MGDRQRILIQLDPDHHASVFDAVVAIDAGVDHLLSYHDVRPDQVEGLVHGAIFTRGGDDLAKTAIFVGGSDVAAGESLLRKIRQSFIGPLRVSVMLDSNGANTTAAAAVLAAADHVDLSRMQAVVLAGTGPVGQRICRMVAMSGGNVAVASRNRERAMAVCHALIETIEVPVRDKVRPIWAEDADDVCAALSQANVVFAAGAAGVQLARLTDLAQHSLSVAIDLNAVPPAGIAGVDATDRAQKRDGMLCYGAIGIGNSKMKLHREALRRMFTRNDLLFDANTLFLLGRELQQG